MTELDYQTKIRQVQDKQDQIRQELRSIAQQKEDFFYLQQNEQRLYTEIVESCAPEERQFFSQRGEESFSLAKRPEYQLEELDFDEYYQTLAEELRTGINQRTGKPLTDLEKAQRWAEAASALALVAVGAYYGKKGFTEGKKASGLEFGNVEKLKTHFSKHGSELKQALNKKNYSIADYLSDANHVIKEDQFVPEMNGYI